MGWSSSLPYVLVLISVSAFMSVFVSVFVFVPVFVSVFLSSWSSDQPLKTNWVEIITTSRWPQKLLMLDLASLVAFSRSAFCGITVDQHFVGWSTFFSNLQRESITHPWSVGEYKSPRRKKKNHQSRKVSRWLHEQVCQWVQFRIPSGPNALLLTFFCQLPWETDWLWKYTIL